MVSEKWNKVEDSIFEFKEKGDSVEGIYKAKEVGGLYGNDVYKIQQSDETIVTVFSTTIMTSMMGAMTIGDKVKIVFNGTKPNTKKGQNDIKMFDVFRASA